MRFSKYLLISLAVPLFVFSQFLKKKILSYQFNCINIFLNIYFKVNYIKKIILKIHNHFSAIIILKKPFIKKNYPSKNLQSYFLIR